VSHIGTHTGSPRPTTGWAGFVHRPTAGAPCKRVSRRRLRALLSEPAQPIMHHAMLAPRAHGHRRPALRSTVDGQDRRGDARPRVSDAPRRPAHTLREDRHEQRRPVQRTAPTWRSDRTRDSSCAAIPVISAKTVSVALSTVTRPTLSMLVAAVPCSVVAAWKTTDR
jgi:hypothetical protein